MARQASGKPAGEGRGRHRRLTVARLSSSLAFASERGTKMQFTELLRDAAARKIYLKISDGTEFRGTVTKIGADFIQVETDNGRAYTVLVAHILFAGL
jgi:hypothetical protein